jgi:hypothetical protein
VPITRPYESRDARVEVEPVEVERHREAMRKCR